MASIVLAKKLSQSGMLRPNIARLSIAGNAPHGLPVEEVRELYRDARQSTAAGGFPTSGDGSPAA